MVYASPQGLRRASISGDQEGQAIDSFRDSPLENLSGHGNICGFETSRPDSRSLPGWRCAHTVRSGSRDGAVINRAATGSRDNEVRPGHPPHLPSRARLVRLGRRDHDPGRQHHCRFRGRDDGRYNGGCAPGRREGNCDSDRWRPQRAPDQRAHPRLQDRDPGARSERAFTDRQRLELQLEAPAL